MSEKDPLDDLPWPKPAEPGAAVSEHIKRQCTHQLGGQRCARAHRRAALSLLLPTLVIGLLSWFGATHSDSQATLRTAFFGVAGWAVVLVAVLGAGLATPPGRRPARAVRLVIAVMVPVLFILYITATAQAHATFGSFSHGATAAHAVRCGAFCLALGSIVSGGVLLLWRGTDPLSPGLSGAFAGLVGGLSSALAVGVACPSHEAWHVGLSHGLVVVAMVGLGAAVGRRLLAP